MDDLNDLVPPSWPWTITEAVDINDSGQILVQATQDGTHGAFILTPN